MLATPNVVFPRRVRNTVLAVHITASVGLLGDILALTAVLLKARSTDDPATAAACYEVMSMFSLVFGIPLSMTALVSGLALGWGTRWGVLRYRWVIAKLALTVGVILAGALVIGPAEGVLTSSTASAGAVTGAEQRVLVATCLQIGALLSATGLSVFKPGRRRKSRPTIPR